MGELENATLFDIHTRQVLQKVPYPGYAAYTPDFVSALEMCIMPDFLVMIYVDQIGIYRIQRDPMQIKTYEILGGYRKMTAPFPVRGHLFFYGLPEYQEPTPGGTPMAIDPEGNFVENAQGLMEEWLNTTWYASEGRRETQREMIRDGNCIIIDGNFYPATAKHVLWYFRRIGIAFDNEVNTLLNHDYPPTGVALNGDIYQPTNKNTTYVLSQTGRIETVVERPQVYRDIDKLDPEAGSERRRQLSTGWYTVHLTGDYYFFYAVKNDKAYLMRASKTWGTDYVALARDGLGADEQAMRKRLEGLSSVELRIVRNALFALQGYTFQSWDLANYFGGYPWYKPDPAVIADPANLPEPQQRLLAMILLIERRRATAVSAGRAY